MDRPEPTEFDPYYAKYINLVPETELVAALESQLADMLGVVRAVPEAEANVRHAPYTWSIKEVVGHLADTERVMGYRALRFARGDTTPLPGFDENAYAIVAEFDRLRLSDLVAEFEAVRRSHIWLFRNLPADAWTRAGEANGKRITVRALAFILVGHGRHHTAIVRKRLAGAKVSERG
jgi:DinB superfamily